MFIEACLISFGLHAGSELSKKIKKKLNEIKTESARAKSPSRSQAETWEQEKHLPKTQFCHASETSSPASTELTNYQKPDEKKQKKISSDAVDKKEEKEAEHYLKTSTASLILSPASAVFPALSLLSLGTLIYSSIPILKLAGNSVREKKIRNDLLNGLIILGCIATGNYFVAALAAWLFHLGSKIVAKTRTRSEKMLTEVYDRRPGKAWVLKDDVEVEVPLDMLDINDIVLINTGEAVPVDGIIIQGVAIIDQHALTGESVPAEKSLGDQVFASTLIVRGRICVKVEKAGKDTLASKLSNILRHTADFKTQIQAKGEEWADKVAPPLLGIGGLTLPILGTSPALAMLNSSPGNMLRVFTSLQTLNHLTLASRKGILIKDGRALEELSKVDTVIFDKTGTLTKKQPKVGHIFCYNGYKEDAVLRYTAAAEQKITHPFAKAILDKAKDRGLTLPETKDSKYHVGYGITAWIENKVIQTGSIRFMEMEGIAIPDKTKETAGQPDSSNLIMVAINRQLVGAVEIQTQIRPEVEKIIRGLRDHGISHISIVSGDHRQPTQQLAEYLGMDSYFYNILPKNKADIVARLQKEGRSVCFIGDGINDAIAMKTANVSVSLSGATSVATDTAQVVLMDGTLSHLCDLFDISKDLDANLHQSLMIGLGNGIINIGCVMFLGLGILGSLIMVDTLSLGVGISHAMLPLKQIYEQEEEYLQIT